MIEFIKDISVVIGLWFVFYKIASWHIEHRGKRNLELAEETLALFYEARDAIAWMRNPAGFEGETDSVKQKPHESQDEFDARKKASVIFVRYNQNKELFNKIQSLRYRFMAQIGKDKAQPFDALNAIIKKIIISARMLARTWPERHFRNDEDREQNSKSIRKNEDIFWDTFSDEDPITPELNLVIENIEKSCQEVIMAKGTLHGFLVQKINMEKKMSDNKKSEKYDLKLFIALAACLASVFSSFSSCSSAREAIKANKFNSRPYVTIELAQNPVIYNGPPFVVLPYQLKNIGSGPALKINKSYVSYLIGNAGNERKVQEFKEPKNKTDALLPEQSSAIHMDNINITGFDLSTTASIKVNVKITYMGDPEFDNKKYYSQAFFRLYPMQSKNGKIVFAVSQPKLDYGIES